MFRRRLNSRVSALEAILREKDDQIKSLQHQLSIMEQMAERQAAEIERLKRTQVPGDCYGQ